MSKYKTYIKSWVKRLKYLWRIKSINIGRLEVKPDEYKKRIGVCLACKYLNGNDCEICECNIYDKSQLITESCPKEKWK